MKVAVIGSGISGLTAAWMLQTRHEVSIFEADDRLGGHTHTVKVAAGKQGEDLPVDTGFIVFNRRTYPTFCRLLEKLNVAARDSDMGFSVEMQSNKVAYHGRGFWGLFAQPWNLFRPAHWRMLRDLLRFYREAPALLTSEDSPTLGEYLQTNGYSKVFLDEHLVPMAAAVWSTDPADILNFPARTLIQFFRNHGFLDVRNRPQWLTVKGGSRTYVDAIHAALRGPVFLSTPVLGLRREDGKVHLKTADGEQEFDQVVVATHGDTALRMLTDASPLEREILTPFGFQANDVVLHQDSSLMPKAKRTWSAWNYFVPSRGVVRATVTYWMNRLQGTVSAEPLLVTLNRSNEIDPQKVLGSFTYDHPIFSAEAVSSQDRHAEISGTSGIHFCGAYWRNGFHEDGAWSALRVAEELGASEEFYA
ncbi:MAG: FAD-dependent oxidoreductase [Planctomycetes bacterium]|nr:FAD-dependent oxidoreductase [Planctomycetota bacterium]MCP4860578.1 FAD-dependent oxidoreductase [Planctomycetota bacterium]